MNSINEEDRPADMVVLGCGPAGLLAAQAGASYGLDVKIVSHKVKSKIAGAQFLHQPIPEITDPKPDFIIDVRHVGNAAGYARKVYGDPDAPTSWSSYDGAIPGWDLRKAYDLLWDVWQDNIFDRSVNHETVGLAVDNYDLVVSSIPLPILAESLGITGDFVSQSVWITDKLSFSIARNTIIYNGGVENDWYRASNIGGSANMEFGHERQDGLHLQKPLTHSLDLDDLFGIQCVGRYGRWEKGVLVHHAYTQILEVLS